MHYLNKLYWTLKMVPKTKKISVGANFRKEVQSVDGYILGKVNSQKLKFSGSSFHSAWITITKFQGNLRVAMRPLVDLTWNDSIATHFFIRKISIGVKNTKTLRKSRASNAWAVIFKNPNFFKSSLQVTKLNKCQHFSNLKFFSVFIY